MREICATFPFRFGGNHPLSTKSGSPSSLIKEGDHTKQGKGFEIKKQGPNFTCGGESNLSIGETAETRSPFSCLFCRSLQTGLCSDDPVTEDSGDDIHGFFWIIVFSVEREHE